MDRVTQQFFQSSWLDGDGDTEVGRILRLHLPLIQAELGHETEVDDVCLLADAGNTLAYLLKVLSLFANIIAFESPSTDYINQRISDSVQADGLSDLAIVDYLDDKHGALKKIANIIAATVIDVDKIWSSSPSTPTLGKVRSRASVVPEVCVSPLFSTGADQEPSSQALPLSREESHPSVVSEDSEKDQFSAVEMKEPLSDLSMEALSVRGKGQYTCPEGHKCTKGGVRPDGQLVVFERNHAFRDHLRRHEKPFKCDLPGCTNKFGFARIDQLKKHQQTVRHH